MINSQAREYATVLYELGLDKKQVVLIFDSLSKVLENKEISGFFNHPIINKDEKKKILKDSLKLEDSELLYFLYVLIDNNRLKDIKNIYEAYLTICDDNEGILRFDVYSSNELDESLKEEIKKVLENNYKKNVVIKYNIDNKLIGGIVVKHNNEVIDGSIFNHINNLKQILLND